MPASVAERQSLLAELRRITGTGRPARPSGDAAAPMAATGIGPVDEVLGGGLPRGRMSEIIGWRSAGRTALAFAVLAAAMRRGEAVALIDVDGMLDVRSAEAAGIELGRLLWVRAGDGAKGIRAADLVLRAGGFGAVVLDLGEAEARVSDAAWLRLGREVERSGAVLAVVSPRRGAGNFATITLLASQPRPEVLGRGASPRVVLAVEACVAVVRSKLGAPGGAAQITWRRR